MIDIEPFIFTEIAVKLREKYPGIYVTGEYVNKPASFPTVAITEEDNYINQAAEDNSDMENCASLTYDVNVYTNKVIGKKSQAREILKLIDSELYKLNFTRIILTPVPNLNDTTIYRLTARYVAVSDGNTMFRR